MHVADAAWFRSWRPFSYLIIHIMTKKFPLISLLKYTNGSRTHCWKSQATRRAGEDHPRPEAAASGSTADCTGRGERQSLLPRPIWTLVPYTTFFPLCNSNLFPTHSSPTGMRCANQISLLVYLLACIHKHTYKHANKNKKKEFSKSTMIIFSDTVLVLWLFLKICKIYLSLISSDIFFLWSFTFITK